MLGALVLLAVFTLSVATLTVYVAPLVTLATDLVVHEQAPNWVKVVVFAALSFVSAATTDAIQTGHVLVLDNKLLASFIMTVVIAGVTYLLGTKPAGISAKLQAVKLPLLGAGIGAAKAPAAPTADFLRSPSVGDPELVPGGPGPTLQPEPPTTSS